MTKLLLSTVLFFLVNPVFSQVGIFSICQQPTVHIGIEPGDSSMQEGHRIGVRLTFESYFNDTVAVYVNRLCVFKKYLKNVHSGSAGTVSIRASALQEIVIKNGKGDCTQFELKSGYKYLYINRDSSAGWTITYSNLNQGYY